MATPRHGIGTVSESQSQKALTVSEALYRLDCLVDSWAISRSLTAPPGGEAEGDCYIPAAPASGTWTGHENDLAYYQNGAYVFRSPTVGKRVWIVSEGLFRVWDGAVWRRETHGLDVLEQTFERLLQGTLSSGNATPTSVTYNFGSDATDNNGIATTWSGAWTSGTGYRACTSDGGYVEFHLRHAGGDIVFARPAACLRNFTVSLDGVTVGTWLTSSLTYTLSGVAAGLRVLRLTRVTSGDTYPATVGSLQYYVLPYQGLGVAGDTVEVLVGLPYLLVHTLGVGSTRANGINTTVYSPAISPRLPQCSANNDLALAGAAVYPAGWTDSLSSMPMARFPIAGQGFQYAGTQLPPLVAGEQLALTANAATRGRRVTAADGTLRSIVGPALGASSVHDNVWAALVRVATLGSGSAFSVGDLALLVMVTSVTTASTSVTVQANDSASVGADLFRLPADLL